MKIILCIGAIFAGFSGADIYGQALSLSAAPLSSTIVIGQPVVLRCAFSNESGEGIELDLGDNDAGAVSFMLSPKSPGERELPCLIRRGGYVLQTRETILPRQTSYRFILLDQWYQPTSVCAVKIAINIRQKTGTLSDTFTVDVENRDDDKLMRGVDTLLTRFEPFRKLHGKVSTQEIKSYEQAVLLALSYLPLRPGDLLERLKIRFKDDKYTLKLIEEAKVMGPGGRKILN